MTDKKQPAHKIRDGRLAATFRANQTKEGKTLDSSHRDAALRAGRLIDVTATARQAGFDYPTALTRQVWSQCVDRAPLPTLTEADRIWLVVWNLRCEINAYQPDQHPVYYEHLVQTPLGDERVRLKAICEPERYRYAAKRFITILLADELE